ncbi:MAG: RDD family protein, partial [Mesorhizobium sp.]
MNARVLDGEIITSRLEDVRAYEGVRTRRILAFVIDYFIVALLTIPFAILVFLLGLLTLGLGWMLFSILVPAVAILYIWNTLGSKDQATTGMKVMGIRLDRLDG